MEYNKDRVDEMVLALLYLTSSHDKYGTRAWKGIDLEAMDRLYKKGYITDPSALGSVLCFFASAPLGPI